MTIVTKEFDIDLSFKKNNVDELLKHIKKGHTTSLGERTPMNLIIKEVIRKKGRKTKAKQVD